MATQPNRQPRNRRAWGVRTERNLFGPHSRRSRGSAAARVLLVFVGAVLLLLGIRSQAVRGNTPPAGAAQRAEAEYGSLVAAETSRHRRQLPLPASAAVPPLLIADAPAAADRVLESKPAPAALSACEIAPAEQRPIDPRVREIDVIYSSVTDPAERVALAGEMAGIDDPEAVRRLLNWISVESDTEVRQDLLYALASAEARSAIAPEVVPVLQRLHGTLENYEDRSLVLEVLAEVPTAEGVEFLQAQLDRDDADPYEQLTACESLMRASALDPDLFEEEQISRLQTRLQLEAQAADSEPELQSQALMALGVRKEDNREFFEQMLTSAKDPEVRRLLAKLVQ